MQTESHLLAMYVLTQPSLCAQRVRGRVRAQGVELLGFLSLRGRTPVLLN